MRRGSSYVCALLLLAVPASASAGPAPSSTVLATDLLSPLSQGVAADGTLWYSENYGGRLHELSPSGVDSVVATAPSGIEIAAVSVGPDDTDDTDDTVYYSVTGEAHTLGRLHARTGSSDTVIADLYAHERETNPDGASTYGFRDLPASCRVRGGRASYTGKTETHPVASLPAYGAVYVADAAANAITVVAGSDVTTVMAFPPVRTTMTLAYASENGFPDCTVGLDYWAEAVPTDVERGPYGSLYVTTLPGGPGQLDGKPLGTLWRVLVLTGQAVSVVTGLDNPVGLAVADSGEVYVSELQADRVSTVAVGATTATPYASMTFPGDVEWTPDGLVVGEDVLSGTSGSAGDPPRGELVRLE